jgi:hypothetical protein
MDIRRSGPVTSDDWMPASATVVCRVRGIAGAVRRSGLLHRAVSPTEGPRGSWDQKTPPGASWLIEPSPVGSRAGGRRIKWRRRRESGVQGWVTSLPRTPQGGRPQNRRSFPAWFSLSRHHLDSFRDGVKGWGYFGADGGLSSARRLPARAFPRPIVFSSRKRAPFKAVRSGWVTSFNPRSQVRILPSLRRGSSVAEHGGSSEPVPRPTWFSP